MVPRWSWSTSSYSVNNGECVEVGTCTARIAVRDSKNRAGAVLEFSAGQFGAFIAGIRAGEFE